MKIEESDLWIQLLSRIRDDILLDILSDVDQIHIDNFISPKIRIHFNTIESFNLFNLTIKNEKSRNIIEREFTKSFGSDFSLIIDPPSQTLN
tara:strand:+ start:8779 stop:9054 length:276 start_codon:yes stop_codon:yes gene_type:complete